MSINVSVDIGTGSFSSVHYTEETRSFNPNVYLYNTLISSSFYALLSGGNVYVGDQIISGSVYITGSDFIFNGGDAVFNGTFLINGNPVISGSLTVNSSSVIVSSQTSSMTVLSSSYAITSSFAQTASYAGDYTLLSEFRPFTASYQIASSSISTRLTDLEYFSSSLDNTFATDAQLNYSSSVLSSSIAYLSSSYLTDSASFDVRILNNSASISYLSSSFLNFSSSLNNTYATDAELNYSSSVLSSSIAYLSSSYLNSSASFNTRILNNSASISLLSGSYLNSSSSFSIRVSDLEQFSSSLNNTYATDAELNAATASLSSSIAFLSSSYLTDSASFNTRILNNSSSIAYLSSSYLNSSASFNTRILNNSSSIAYLSSSFLIFSSSYNTGSFTGSFTGSLLGTASYALQALSSSYALTASYVNPLHQDVIITGSLLVTQSHISTVDYIDFNTTVTPAFLTGRIHWVDDTKTLQIDTDVANFEIELGHQNVVRGRNTTGYTLTKGMVVYINGESGNRPTFTTASWTGDPTSAATLGFIVQDIIDNQTGYVVTNGILRGINTNAFAPGTQLYLSSSGQYTSTVPISPNHEVRLGKTITQATNGYIYVDIMNGYELGELHDVLINGKTNGDLISWDSGSRVWKNTKTLSGSYNLSGSLTTNDGISTVSITSSFISASSITGSLFGTSSWANNAVTSSYILNAVSSSYASTASYVNELDQNVIISGSLTVIGSSTFYGSASFVYVTASQLALSQSFISVNVFEPLERFGGLKVYDSGSSTATASLAWDSLHNHWVYQNVSGSTYTGGMLLAGPRNTGSLGDEPTLATYFIPRSDGGDHLENSQIFSSGSVHIVTGSLTSTGGFTGSLKGTASWADNAVTASYITLAQTASYVLNAVSSSFASTASYVNLAQTASYVQNAQTASYVLQAVSSSFASTSSYVLNAVSSSYALTASYVANASSFPYTGSAIITGSLIITGSVSSTGGYTGSLFGTSSWANNAVTASYVLNAVSASYAPNTGVTKIIAGTNITISPLNGIGNVTINSTATGGGGTSGSNYVATFSSQSIWEVNHNLGNRYVIIQAYDSDYNEIIPENVQLTSISSSIITFPVSESGYAIVSLGGALSSSYAITSSYALSGGTVSGGAISGSFGLVIDGGGSTITTGNKGYAVTPYGGTITGWTVIADQSGSCVIDVWKATNTIPTVANTIAGTEKPTLTSQQLNSDTNLTTWTTSVLPGDIFSFNVDSVSTVTRLNLTIFITKQ